MEIQTREVGIRKFIFIFLFVLCSKSYAQNASDIHLNNQHGASLVQSGKVPEIRQWFPSLAEQISMADSYGWAPFERMEVIDPQGPNPYYRFHVCQYKISQIDGIRDVTQPQTMHRQMVRFTWKDWKMFSDHHQAIAKIVSPPDWRNTLVQQHVCTIETANRTDFGCTDATAINRDSQVLSVVGAQSHVSDNLENYLLSLADEKIRHLFMATGDNPTLTSFLRYLSQRGDTEREKAGWFTATSPWLYDHTHIYVDAENGLGCVQYFENEKAEFQGHFVQLHDSMNQLFQCEASDRWVKLVMPILAIAEVSVFFPAIARFLTVSAEGSGITSLLSRTTLGELSYGYQGVLQPLEKIFTHVHVGSRGFLRPPFLSVNEFHQLQGILNKIVGFWLAGKTYRQAMPELRKEFAGFDTWLRIQENKYTDWMRQKVSDYEALVGGKQTYLDMDLKSYMLATSYVRQGVYLPESNLNRYNLTYQGTYLSLLDFIKKKKHLLLGVGHCIADHMFDTLDTHISNKVYKIRRQSNQGGIFTELFFGSPSSAYHLAFPDKHILTNKDYSLQMMYEVFPTFIDTTEQ